MRDFVSNGLRPLLAGLVGEPVPEEGMHALLGDYGNPVRLHAAAAAWHARPLLSNDHGSMPPDAAWPVPFDAIHLPGEKAVAIASMVDLVAEGGRGPDRDGIPGLSHCVASFGERCAQGRSLIVSLREAGTGLRLSTLELVPSPGGGWRIGGRPYRTGQHSGLRNADPPEAAVGMCEALRSILADGFPVVSSAPRPAPLAGGQGADPGGARPPAAVAPSPAARVERP